MSVFIVHMYVIYLIVQGCYVIVNFSHIDRGHTKGNVYFGIGIHFYYLQNT